MRSLAAASWGLLGRVSHALRLGRLLPFLAAGLPGFGVALALNLLLVARFSLRHLLHLPRTRPHFVAYWVKRLPAPGPVAARKLLGKPLLTWTVRTPEERTVAAAHADQMIFEGFDPEA